MTITEYRAKRAKHIQRIKMIRSFGLLGNNMIENEQWLLAVARTQFYHPERIGMVMAKVDHFVSEKLMPTL